MAQGSRTGSNPNVADLSGLFRMLSGGSADGNASYVPGGGGMGGRRGVPGGGQRSAPAPSGPTKGQQRADGKFYTGPAYGWQSGISAAKAGLLGSEVVGDAAFSRVNSAPSPMGAPSLPQTFASVSPQERAYQSTKAETAAMSESDPLFKKYQVADLTKAYNTATDPNEKERIGLQIWATTNPKLAAKLKPGQTGYQEASSLFGTQTFGTNQPGVTQADINTLSETVGAPAMQEGANYAQAFTSPTNLGLGVNAQQTAYSPQGEAPPSMLGAQAFSIPNALNTPDISETQRKLLIEAFNRRLK
jgi:hypothetical protein